MSIVKDTIFEFDQKEEIPSLIYNELIFNKDNHEKVNEIFRDNRLDINTVDHAGRAVMTLIVQNPCPPEIRAHLIRNALEHGADPFKTMSRINKDCVAVAIIKSLGRSFS